MGFLLGVGEGVTGQVVGVVRQERAVRAAVQLGAAPGCPTSAMPGLRPLFGEQIQRAATAHLKDTVTPVSDQHYHGNSTDSSFPKKKLHFTSTHLRSIRLRLPLSFVPL